MTTRVFREDDQGRWVPVPQLDPPSGDPWPTASEVIEALRSFLEQSQDEDRLLMNPRQARVLVERWDEAQQAAMGVAELLGMRQDAPQPPAGAPARRRR